MKKTVCNILFLGLVFSYAPFAIPAEGGDDSVTVIGSAAYIFKNSELTVSGQQLEPQYTSVEWAVVLAYKNLYSRFSFDQSLKGHTEVNNNTNADGEIENSILTLEREDAAFTLGFSISDSMSVFAGYKSGETSGINGSVLRTFNPGSPEGTIVVNSDISFKEDGPFIGFSYTYFTQNTGSVNLSIAYADLDGEVTIASPELDTNDEIFIQTQKTTGDNTGLSYSISWTDRFLETINYTIGLNIIRYTFEGPPLPNGDDFSFDNNFTNFSIAFSKIF